MDNKSGYDEWLAGRRAIEPPSDLTDRAMVTVEAGATQRPVARLSDRLNASLPARWGVCIASLLVGCLPFLYVAYAAKLVPL